MKLFLSEPLGPNGGAKPDYLTLEQALEQDLVRITEMDERGSVPELKLLNEGKKSVLIVEGEELVDAKQNRIVNSSFLIAAKTGVVIPVSCVEQGRWRYDSDRFVSGNVPNKMKQRVKAAIETYLQTIGS